MAGKYLLGGGTVNAKHLNGYGDRQDPPIDQDQLVQAAWNYFHTSIREAEISHFGCSSLPVRPEVPPPSTMPQYLRDHGLLPQEQNSQDVRRAQEQLHRSGFAVIPEWVSKEWCAEMFSLINTIPERGEGNRPTWEWLKNQPDGKRVQIATPDPPHPPKKKGKQRLAKSPKWWNETFDKAREACVNVGIGIHRALHPNEDAPAVAPVVTRVVFLRTMPGAADQAFHCDTSKPAYSMMICLMDRVLLIEEHREPIKVCAGSVLVWKSNSVCHAGAGLLPCETMIRTSIFMYVGDLPKDQIDNTFPCPGTQSVPDHLLPTIYRPPSNNHRNKRKR